MKANSFILIFSFFILWACENSKQTQETTPNIPAGEYLGFLDIQGQKLPFEFSIKHQPLVFTLKNGEEEFVINDFTLSEDSLIVPLHIFDTKLVAYWDQGEQSFTGHWIKNYVDNYKIDFSAAPIIEGSSNAEEAADYTELDNKYRVYFESMLKDSTVSVAEFSQNGNNLKGTFLTTTGDYRYLRGSVNKDRLKLFTFDGEHGFVFTATIDSTGVINGNFYSGKTWHETWTAYPDRMVKLKDPSEGILLDEEFYFEAMALNGDSININNDAFTNKPLLIQIMGTWCPNCMDETAFLSEWYNTKKLENLEIISLAFERKDNFNYAKKRLNKLKERYNVSYPLLFAGGSDKDLAAEKLPALSKVIAYPTLVYLNKEHKVEYIHSGFSGPGTGDHYERWKLDFEKKVRQIQEAQ